MLEKLAPALPVSQVVAAFSVSSAVSGRWLGGEAGSTPGQALSDNTDAVNESKPRALVVDDAPDVVEMLAMLLRYSGYYVITASSASEALGTAQGGTFDVVVSDIGMPGMNGYELAKALRTLPDYLSVPMIALTGFAMYDDRDRALEAGFNAFLTKPINPMALIELIERLRNSSQ
jgi:CheY-like chemotaxis protein